MEPAAVLRLLLTAEGVKETQLQLARVNAEAKRTADSTGRLEQAFSRANNKTSDFNKNMMGLRNVISLVRFPALIAGAGAAGQAIGALGAASVSLISALAPLSGALAGFAGLYSALGQGAGVVKLAFAGVSQALNGNKKALAALTPAQRTFVDHLKSMKSELKGLQQTAAQNLFPGLTQALTVATPLLSRLRPIIAATARQLGNLSVSAANMLVSMGPAFTRIGQNNVQVIGNLGHAVIAAGIALITLIDAARPLTLWMSRMIMLGAQWVAQQTEAARASGKLASFLGQTQVVMTQLGHIIANLVVGLFNIGKAAAPLGRDLLTSFVNLTAQFRAWTQSATGKNQIAAYFAAARAPAFAIFRLVGEIGKVVLQVFKPQPGTAGMIGQLQQLVHVLGGILTTTSRTLGPPLIHLIVNLVRILSALAGTSGPLTFLVKTLAAITTPIARAVSHNPALGTMASFLAGVGVTWKVVSLLISPLAKMGENVGKLALAFRNVPAFVTKARAAIAVFLTFLESNPLVLPFTLLGLAIGLALTHMKQFSRGASILWNGIKSAFNQGVATVLGYISTFLHGLGTLLQAISNVPGLGWVGDLAKDVNHAGDSIDRLRNKLTGVNRTTRETRVAFQELAGTTRQNLQSAIQDMLRQYGDFHDKVGQDNRSLVKNFGIAYQLIETYIHTHTGAAKRQGEANLSQLQIAFNRDMDKMSHDTTTNMGHVLTSVGTNTARALQRGSSNISNLQQRGKRSLDTLTSNTSTDTGHMLSLIGSRTAQAAAQSSSHFSSLHDHAKRSLDSATQTTNTDTGRMLSLIGSRTADSARTAAHNMGLFSGNVAHGMQGAWSATRQGIGLISGAVAKALNALGSSAKIDIKLASASVKAITGFARGGMVNQPAYVVGEEAPRHPEVVIATNPAYRAKNVEYWMKAGQMLGMPGFKKGGIPGYATGGYVYPMPGGTRVGRTDQGVDPLAQAGSPFGPIGNATIERTNIGGWPGGPFMYWRLDSGPMAGRYVYLAEMIRPLVHPGQHVRANQTIAVSTGPSQEMGWATASGETLARATSGYTEGNVTPAGSAFRAFLMGLAHGKLVGGGLGALGLTVANLNTPKVSGRGAFAAIAQAALSRVTGAANAKIQAIAATMMPTGTGSIGALPSGSGNVLRDVYRTLKARGWSKIAIAGALGNAWQESGWNPGALDASGRNGGLWGFTSGAISLANLKRTATSRHVQWTDAALQAAFMASHFDGRALAAMNRSHSPSDAARIFEQSFERAGNIQMGNRIAGANRAYAMGYYKGGFLPPYAGSFANGGMVPGPTGAARTAIVHGGETISSNTTSGPLIEINGDLNVLDEFDVTTLAHRLAFLVDR